MRVPGPRALSPARPAQRSERGAPASLHTMLDPLSIALISFAAAGVGGSIGFGCGAAARKLRDDRQWRALNSQLSTYFARPRDFERLAMDGDGYGLDLSHLSKADMCAPLGVEDSLLPASHGSSFVASSSSATGWNSRSNPLRESAEDLASQAHVGGEDFAVDVGERRR